MKKRVFIFALCLSMIFTHMTCAFNTDADKMPEPLERFEITGGLDAEKETETTFDTDRAISGAAEKDTEIMIVVYKAVYHDDETEYEEINTYEFTVGPSGLFSQTVDLELGENYIQIIAAKGKKQSVVEAVIKRKDSEIKSELSQIKALPGQRTSAAKTN